MDRHLTELKRCGIGDCHLTANACQRCTGAVADHSGSHLPQGAIRGKFRAVSNLTAKREAFCLAYMESGNQSEAYRIAFDAENMKAETVHKRASELMANGEVKGRIAELQARAAERALVTVQSLTQELEEARALALQEGQPSAAVSASMGKAKLHGLLTDKQQTEHTGTIVTEVRRVIVDGKDA